jgi:ascorbate-specific PTS system EIIC-type component UlaA
MTCFGIAVAAGVLAMLTGGWKTATFCFIVTSIITAKRKR